MVTDHCLWCSEPIADGEPFDRTPVVGATGAYIGFRHIECAIRMMAGSVGHQLQLCRCDGGPGTLDDPEGPDITKRYAAQLAASTARALCTALEAEAQRPGIHERVCAALRAGALDAMANGWDDMTPDLSEGLHAAVRAAVRGTMGQA